MKHCHADVLLSALMYLKSQTQVTKHKKALSKLKVSVCEKFGVSLQSLFLCNKQSKLVLYLCGELNN